MFLWTNRSFCLRRIHVLVCCKQISVEQAIHEALHHKRMHDSEYAYCRNPDQISGRSLELLRRDAAAYIAKHKGAGSPEPKRAG